MTGEPGKMAIPCFPWWFLRGKLKQREPVDGIRRLINVEWGRGLFLVLSSNVRARTCCVL